MNVDRPLIPYEGELNTKLYYKTIEKQNAINLLKLPQVAKI